MKEKLIEIANRIAYCIELNELPEDAVSMLHGEIDELNKIISEIK